MSAGTNPDENDPESRSQHLLAEIARTRSNVIVAGATGAGKSTLINTIFGEALAEVGQGAPVTRAIKEYSKPGYPLTIFDTRGLEMVEYDATLRQVEELVCSRAREADPNRHIHLAWICISEDSRRVQPGESRLAAVIARHMPVIVIITKMRSDNGFSKTVKELVPEASDVVRVRAFADVDDEGNHFAVKNIDKLLDATERLIPEAQWRAVVAAQRVSLERKRESALKIVERFAENAGAAALLSSTVGTVTILLRVLTDMLSSIHHAFGVPQDGSSTAWTFFWEGAQRSPTEFFKALAGESLKTIPVVGSISGGWLSRSSARAATLRCGAAYVEVLFDEVKAHRDGTPLMGDRWERYREKLKA